MNMVKFAVKLNKVAVQARTDFLELFAQSVKCGLVEYFSSVFSDKDQVVIEAKNCPSGFAQLHGLTHCCVPSILACMILTYRFRVKDKKRIRVLREKSWMTNQVWNYCVALQRRYPETWFSHFDLVNATKQVGKEFGVHSDTRSSVCAQFTNSRNTHKKIPKFRKSGGSKRSLGWVPFIRRAAKLNGDCVTYQETKFRFYRHRDFNEAFKTGCFTEESSGKWFVTFTTEAPEYEQAPDSAVGIDLGLKDMATLSNGEKLEAKRIYRGLESKLGIAQRANNKKRVRAIHAKIKNTRKHFNHVESCRIARQHRTVVVGNVSASKLAKTKMAKSVLDAGWYQFKTNLAYKVSRHQGTFKEVNEAYSTQTCSSCGSKDSSQRPIGFAGLEIRDWECTGCGTKHDRDVNAALNILCLGLESKPLVGESPCL